jgi:hypothetical protein
VFGKVRKWGDAGTWRVKADLIRLRKHEGTGLETKDGLLTLGSSSPDVAQLLCRLHLPVPNLLFPVLLNSEAGPSRALSQADTEEIDPRSIMRSLPSLERGGNLLDKGRVLLTEPVHAEIGAGSLVGFVLDIVEGIERSEARGKGGRGWGEGGRSVGIAEIGGVRLQGSLNVPLGDVGLERLLSRFDDIGGVRAEVVDVRAVDDDAGVLPVNVFGDGLMNVGVRSAMSVVMRRVVEEGGRCGKVEGVLEGWKERGIKGDGRGIGGRELRDGLDCSWAWMRGRRRTRY